MEEGTAGKAGSRALNALDEGSRACLRPSRVDGEGEERPVEQHARLDRGEAAVCGRPEGGEGACESERSNRPGQSREPPAERELALARRDHEEDNHMCGGGGEKKQRCATEQQARGRSAASRRGRRRAGGRLAHGREAELPRPLRVERERREG
eukprot:scaffold38702_cov30-Tisochrysis_lutea.AAC.6